MATLNEKMTAIADAIRERTDETNKLTLDDMATGISKVYEKGYELGDNVGHTNGYMVGHNQGYAEGYPAGAEEGYSNGKEDMNDAWWRVKTANFTRTGYDYGFTNENFTYVGGFNPPIQIKPQGYSSRIFNGAKGLGEITADKLDLSLCNTMEYTFSGAETPRIELINTTGSSTVKALFSVNEYIITVDRVILKDDGSQLFSETSFGHLSRLENITFVGVIGNDIWFTRSPNLTRNSVISIFNALKDYSDEGRTHTVDLHATCINNLSDADKAIATQKGWTIS